MRISPEHSFRDVTFSIDSGFTARTDVPGSYELPGEEIGLVGDGDGQAVHTQRRVVQEETQVPSLQPTRYSDGELHNTANHGGNVAQIDVNKRKQQTAPFSACEGTP